MKHKNKFKVGDRVYIDLNPTHHNFIAALNCSYINGTYQTIKKINLPSWHYYEDEKTYQMENDPRSRHFFYEADLRFEIVNGLSGLFKNIQNFPTKIIRIIKHEL